jgi:hypothetical protein
MVSSFPRAAGSVRSLLTAPFVAAAVVGALSACAAPASGPAAGGVDVRVLVKLARPSEDASAIAAEATRQAGVPASYAAAVSPAWHALSLHCTSATACDAAIARLRQASAVYEIVELEGRKRRAAVT